MSKSAKVLLLNKAILRTLAYADVFDYPLSAPEVWRFLITQRKIKEDSVLKELLRMEADSKLIQADKSFYFLKGRKKVVGLRKRRERWSRGKLKIALRVGRWLRLIPWIKMAAVTGALAMENSDEDDDIDILIVTAENRLWLTRLLVFLLVELMAQRRRPGDQRVKDKICLNMFLDESDLCLPQEEQNLFAAHEVCQLKPLWSRNGIYRKFIEENKWVKKYLPNWMETGDIKTPPRWGGQLSGKDTSDGDPKGLLRGGGKNNLFDYLEILTRKVQLLYMAPRRTTEIAEPHRVRFHPQDCREWVLKEYRRRLKKLNLAQSLV